MNRALVIVNPRAGRGRALRIAASVERQLHDHAVDVDLRVTDAPDHATELARTRHPESDLVVVVGGDGTLREAAEGLIDSDVNIGFIPLGHGNVLARELSIPLDPLAAIDVLFAGRPLQLDVGRVNGRLFLAMVGVGYDALVTRIVDAFRRTSPGRYLYRWTGDCVYVGSGLLALGRLFPTRFELTVDGIPLERRPSTAVVSNTETYAKGWAVTPGATVADGKLDFAAIWHAFPPLAAWALLQAKRRRHVAPFFGRYGRGTRFVIEAERAFRWQADGDPMEPVRRLEIEIEPRAIAVLTMEK